MSPPIDNAHLKEATLRRYNQMVYRAAALTWVITHVFDWFLLTMSLDELISSAFSRVAIVAILWAMSQWVVRRCSWHLTGMMFMVINFGSLWGVSTYLWMPSVGGLAMHAMILALSTLANILILGVVRSGRITLLAGMAVVGAWYLFVAPEHVYPAEVSWILLGFVLGFATLLYFSIESITVQMFEMESSHRNALMAEKNNLEAVIQSMADAVVLTDKEGIITRANSAFLAMTGREEAEVQGMAMGDCIAPSRAQDRDEDEREGLLKLDDTIFDREVSVGCLGAEPVKAFMSGATVRDAVGEAAGRIYVLRDARTSPLAARLNLAELKALKAQINPHFLFNTINTISSLIMTNPEKAETAIQLLSMHFRNVLSVSEKEWVTLEEELDFLKAYLEILQFRHEDQLEVVYRVDSDCMPIRVPTMLLQPLAENAIRHGFRDKMDRWRIELDIDRLDGYCRIRLTDNGAGMPRSKMAAIFNGEGHGLKNVSQRLQLYFGDEGQIAVDSGPQQGTTFTIRFPLHGEHSPPMEVPT